MRVRVRGGGRAHLLRRVLEGAGLVPEDCQHELAAALSEWCAKCSALRSRFTAAKTMSLSACMSFAAYCSASAFLCTASRTRDGSEVPPGVGLSDRLRLSPACDMAAVAIS